jgi:cold shock CspA family protein
MSTDSVVTTSADTSSSERYTGRVKWFNTKAGYGFITITDGSKSGSDVFVHHSSINVENEQYRYLVQGEYVEFTLSNVMKGDHEYQAGDVSGIKGGKLMCETRRDLRSARTQYKTSKGDEHESKRMPKMGALRHVKDTRKQNDGGWHYVKKDSDNMPNSTTPTRPPRAPRNVQAPRAPMKERPPRL